MNKQNAQNTMNMFLSDRFTFSGTDLPAVLGIFRDLQADILNGPEADKTSGDTQAESN